MTDELDTVLRRLVGELADASPTPHDWSRVSLQPMPAPPSRTPVYLAIAATSIAVVAGVATLVIVADDDPAPGDHTVPPVSTAPPITDPSVVSDPSTPATVPSTADDVSYRNPPPQYVPEPFASVEVSPVPLGLLPPFAVIEDGVVVVDDVLDEAIVLADDPAQGMRRVPLEATAPHGLVGGPGDVLYGLAQTDDPQVLQFVAIALSGERAGEVVAAEDVEAVRYTELPRMPFGHGHDGVTDRVRVVGDVLIGYVDADGARIDPGRDWPDIGSAIGDGKMWDFDVERHPDWREPFTDDSGAAPTADEMGVYWTWIGPDAGRGGDFGNPTMPVIAALGDGGAVTWWRLPDGWQLVASDVWGTLLAHRLDDRRIELAWFDPAATPPDAGGPTTTTTPRSEPEWPGQLDIDLDTGTVTAPGFNEWVADAQPAWADDARQMAVMLTPPRSDPAEVVTVGDPVNDGALVAVTVTVSNLMDDSGEAVRYRFRLDSADVDGLFRFVEGSYSWRCQPDRGHQDFTTAPCT